MSQRRSDATAAAATAQTDAMPAATDASQSGGLHPVENKINEAPASEAQAMESTTIEREQELLSTIETLSTRVEKLERRSTRSRLLAIALLLAFAYLGLDHFFPESVVVQQTLMESTEVKLVDNDGNARLFLRMFSRVPVLQLLGENGTPRMSLGLRFDNTPFIDLSDATGRTRATFEITQDDTPLIQFYDGEGNKTTRLN